MLLARPLWRKIATFDPNNIKFLSCNFWSSKFWIRIRFLSGIVESGSETLLDPLLKFWIRIGIQPEMLDPDPESINTDPKHC